MVHKGRQRNFICWRRNILHHCKYSQLSIQHMSGKLKVILNPLLNQNWYFGEIWLILRTFVTKICEHYFPNVTEIGSKRPVGPTQVTKISPNIAKSVRKTSWHYELWFFVNNYSHRQWLWSYLVCNIHQNDKHRFLEFPCKLLDNFVLGFHWHIHGKISFFQFL